METDAIVYVLRLAEGKYYVGYTAKDDVMDRVCEHTWKLENAAEWTKLYSVLELVDIYPDATPETERDVTLEYMRRHGWQNVRGSIYCAVNLRESPVELLAGKADKVPLQHLKVEHSKVMVLKNCHNCNQPGHFAADCTKIFCRLCSGMGHVAAACPKKDTTVTCYQCGERGHLRTACPVKEARCFSCKQPGHYSSSCPSKKSKVSLSKTYGECFKCHQTGHWARNCPSSSN